MSTYSLRTRLLASYQVLIGLIALVGVLSITGCMVIHAQYNSVLNRAEPLLTANAAALQAMTDAETGVRGFQITDDESFLQPYRRGASTLPDQLSAADIAAAHDGHARALVAAERTAAQRWLDDYAAPVAARETLTTRQGKALFDEFRVANGSVQRYAEARRVRVGRDAVLATWSVLGLLSLAMLAAVLLSWRTARRSMRSLLAPLDSLRDTVRSLGEGDHSARAEETGPVELLTVAESVNHLAAETQRLEQIDAEHQRRDEAVRSVERAMRPELDPEAVLARAVEVLGIELGAARVVIRTVHDGRPDSVAAAWSADGETVTATGEKLRRVPEALLALLEPTVADQSALAVDDLSGSRWRSDPVVRNYLAASRVRAALNCPLVEGGQMVGFLSVHETEHPRAWSATDISIVELAAREVTVALRQARLYSQQVQMVDQLRTLDRDRDVFVSTVSHELRTPLTSIAGYIELLTDEDDELTPQQRSMLEIIERNTSRLQTLIEDLLTLSRIESGSFALAKVPMRVGPVLIGACEALRPAAENGRVTMVFDDEATDAVVAADVVQIERVALNLISNAVKFTPPGGSVTVRTVVRDSELVLSVADTGVGIAPAEQSKLFQRFFRASTATDLAIPGTGLGLTVVQSIVTAHGGSITVESDVGRGTTFSVALPLLRSAELAHR